MLFTAHPCAGANRHSDQTPAIASSITVSAAFAGAAHIGAAAGFHRPYLNTKIIRIGGQRRAVVTCRANKIV
jgi:hypothetical protein